MAQLLQMEREIRRQWYPIAPDGEVPNSIIREILNDLRGDPATDAAFNFKDLASLIASVSIELKSN